MRADIHYWDGTQHRSILQIWLRTLKIACNVVKKQYDLLCVVQEVACTAPNLMSMLLPKKFIKGIWALDLQMSGESCRCLDLPRFG